MRAKESLLNGVTILTGVCAAILVLRNSWPVSSPVRGEAEPTTVSAAEVQDLIATGHRIGPDSAVLTVIEFGDFQCPICGSYEQILDTMRQRYPTEFAVVFHHLPLSYHPLAYPLARASECAASQGRFTAMHDLLFTNQKRMGIVSVTDLARQAAIPNMIQFTLCSRNTTAVATIEQDKRDAERLGVPGTPAIIVGGTMHTTDLDVHDLELLLTSARRRVSDGRP